jgi:CRP/FNR family cyclic AMP-dependent transcriptional regulator
MAGKPAESGIVEALAGVDLLQGLDAEVLAGLADRVVRRRWAAGELVVEQGTPGGSLIVLLSGSATVYRSTGPQARAALNHLRAPAVVGEVTLLDAAPRTASVEAVEDIAAVELSRDDMLALLRAHPPFLDALLRSLGMLVRRLSDQAADHVLLDFPTRVAKTLVLLCDGDRQPQVVRLSQSRLAELAGGSRQSLNQVLRTFQERGYVRVEGRVILVEDLDALRRRAGLAVTSRPMAAT